MREKIYTINGRPTTLKAEAARLGVPVEVLRGHMRYRGLGLEAVLALYAAGRIGRGARGEEYHLVHGEWLSARQVAEHTGVAYATITNYRCAHKCLMEEAYDHYADLKAGRTRRGVRTGKRHRVRPNGARPGGLMTVAEAAALLGVSEHALYGRMEQGQSLDAAVRGVEARRQRRAEREIMKILKGDETMKKL